MTDTIRASLEWILQQLVDAEASPGDVTGPAAQHGAQEFAVPP